MGLIADQFARIYRDFSTDGIQASGLHDPLKADIRALGPLIEAALATASLGSLISVAYSTRSALNADLAHPAGTVALVFGDSVDANNDIYTKSGPAGAGGWTLTNALHQVLSSTVIKSAINSVPFVSWSALSSATSMQSGDRATVLSIDTGTHTDPVVGGTVANSGLYTYSTSPAGWKRIADLDSQTAAASALQYTVDNYVGAEEVVANFTWPLIVNALLVGGLRTDGTFQVPALAVSSPVLSGEDIGTGFTPLISLDGVSGAFIVGYDAQGRLDFVPSPQLIARIGAVSGGYLPVSTLRGTWDSSVFNVRSTSGYYVAGVRDIEGRTFDAKMRTAGSQSTLLIDSSSQPLEMLLVMGQSNSGGGGSPGTLVSTALFPYSVMQSAALANGAAYGTAPITASSYSDLVAAYDASSGTQYPGKMTAFALQHYNSIMGRPEPGMIVGTAWEGSQPLSSFFPGTSGHYNYENAIALVTAAKAAALLYGRSLRVTVLFIQGEAGPSGRSTYGDLLGNATGNLLDAILPGIQSAAGMASPPKVVLGQTNVLAGASENYACAGQYDVAQARADTVLGGPMYCYPIRLETGPVYAHLTSLGRMMQGGPLAEAIATVLDTGDWRPVQIASAARSGSYLDLTYDGTVFSQGYKLAFDTDWVPTVTNKGFFAYGAGVPSITNVAITGTNTVRVTFSGTLPAGATFNYAINPSYTNNGTSDGWAERLGNLMVETDRPDLYHRLGYAVPRYIRHYAIRQEITLS